ncbi:uncharacterized protein KY384_006557 [Bacidia gigantensis]|uniref:uncharacterized protein n=1 Tax=Bacidia gigantensis TaxID=2732470 RepID=UPI001D0527E8|nr:uncharacterized protein KY384_006557 [Bacidia gigantensis]KAG8528868.1 hypothetical protein KY384_006557 [Bacidia gigantensis]
MAGFSSEIPLTAVMTGGPETAFASSAIVADSTLRLPTTTATVTQTAAPTTPPPSNNDHHKLTPGTIVAIVVPIAAVILLIPFIFLFYRSHQLKKASNARRAQRESYEGMIQKPANAAETSQAPQITPLRAFGVDPPPGSADESATRHQASRSLGLFNFNISPPHSPSSTPPSTSPFLSIAQAVPIRKSQPSVVDERRPSLFQAEGRQSFPSWAFDSPSIYSTPHIPPDIQSSPSNGIGTAQSPEISRPTLARIPSSRTVTPHRRPSKDRLRPPEQHSPARTRSYPLAINPSIPSGRLELGSPFTISDYLNRSQRHSEVSSMSDDDNHIDKRSSRQSHLISPIQDNGGTQPFRIL